MNKRNEEMTQREWDRVVGIGEVQPPSPRQEIPSDSDSFIDKYVQQPETTFRERVKEDLIKNHVIKDNDKD